MAYTARSLRQKHPEPEINCLKCFAKDLLMQSWFWQKLAHHHVSRIWAFQPCHALALSGKISGRAHLLLQEWGTFDICSGEHENSFLLTQFWLTVAAVAASCPPHTTSNQVKVHQAAFFPFVGWVSFMGDVVTTVGLRENSAADGYWCLADLFCHWFV